MASGSPILCPICGVLHEQPDAHLAVQFCKTVVHFRGQEGLYELRQLKLSDREKVVLSGFPELSEAR